MFDVDLLTLGLSVILYRLDLDAPVLGEARYLN